MSHGDAGVDPVVVAASDSFAGDVAGVDEVGDDALCGAFGDPDGLGEVAETRIGVAAQAEQDLRVVGQEPPGVSAIWRLTYELIFV